MKGKFGIRLVKFTCDAFPPVLLKSLGVLLSQFLSGVTNVGEKFKERGRAVPVDFDVTGIISDPVLTPGAPLN